MEEDELEAAKVAAAEWRDGRKRRGLLTQPYLVGGFTLSY
jgi:hypothetical protein